MIFLWRTSTRLNPNFNIYTTEVTFKLLVIANSIGNEDPVPQLERRWTMFLQFHIKALVIQFQIEKDSAKLKPLNKMPHSIYKKPNLSYFKYSKAIAHAILWLQGFLFSCFNCGRFDHPKHLHVQKENVSFVFHNNSYTFLQESGNGVICHFD